MRTITRDITTKWIAAVALLIIAGFQLNAQKNEISIDIGVESSLLPLAESWIQKHQQVNPGFTINLIEGTSKGYAAQINTSGHQNNNSGLKGDELVYVIGQVPLLPVINENNRHFNREQRRGISQARLKSVFFSEMMDWLDNQNHDQEPEYALYTPIPRSLVAESFSAFFGKQSADLNGIYVSGDIDNLISALLNDPDAISYLPANHVFDPTTKEPIQGLRILPLDLNNNGRLDRNEQIYDNLDQLLTYFAETPNPSIPSITISIALSSDHLSDPSVETFFNWVKNEGQDISLQTAPLRNSHSNQEDLYSVRK